MNKFYSQLLDAIENGINMELLLRSCGLNEADFKKYLNDELFTFSQVEELRITIKEWRKGL